MKDRTLFCSQCGSPYITDGTREHVYCSLCGHKNPGKPLFKSGDSSGKVKVISCPSCGADVLFKDDSGTAVCEYCGSTLMEDRTVIINKYIDETKIKETEAKERLRLKELEHEKEMAEYREKQQEKNRRQGKMLLKLFLWISGGFGYAAFIAWSIAKHNGSDSTAMILFINGAVYSLIAAIVLYLYFTNKKDLSYYLRGTNNQTADSISNQNNAPPVQSQNTRTDTAKSEISAGKVIGGIAAAGVVVGLLRKLFK